MIKGEKTGIRAVERDDLQLLRDWRNIASFRKNFREVSELNMLNQEKWFENVTKSANDFMFVICDLETSQPIGACGLLYINWIIRSADFSIYIGENESYIDKNGYAQDSARVLIEYGFNNLNLNKIWMELYEFDTEKINFFTSEFNFKKEAELRDNCFEEGRYWNSFIFSLLRNENK